MSELLGNSVEFVKNFIEQGGYWGLGALMALDNTNIPLPSEIVLGFAGFLVAEGKFDFWSAVLVAGLGSTVGSTISYWIGRFGGRPLVQHYGHWLLLTRKDLARADKLFKKYGNWIALLSRMVPLLRTFISLPAGITKMPFWQFTLFTMLGSTPWAALIIFIGTKLGANYEIITAKYKGVEYIVFIGLGAALVFWIVRFILEQRTIRRERAEHYAQEHAREAAAEKSKSQRTKPGEEKKEKELGS